MDFSRRLSTTRQLIEETPPWSRELDLIQDWGCLTESREVKYTEPESRPLPHTTDVLMNEDGSILFILPIL